MAPLDFLAAVLPSSGYYCVAELSSNKKEHRYVTSVQELEEIANGFDASHKDAYFALASFSEAGERKADKALYLRSCFFDIDCGEGKDYPTKREALNALVSFLQDTCLGDLGTPWVVSSGGGLHVYWPFNLDVPAETWRGAAENLKRLAKQHNFHIDPSVTADRARVLRVPGTHNYKKENPRPVTIAMEGGVFDFEEFSASLKDKLNGHAYVPDEFGLGARPSFADSNPSTSVKLLVDNQSFDFGKVSEGCLQIKNYMANAEQDGMEPTWRAVLSQAWCCDDGKAWGKKLSDLHPYDDQRFEDKWRELNGAYSCEKMDSVTPGICQGCPHKGKIKNPIALGKKLLTITEEKEVVLDAPQAQTEEKAAPIKVKMPTPPRGFSYGNSSGVFYKRTSRDADGEVLEAEIMILPYYLYAVDVIHLGGNEHSVHYVALKPEGPKDILIDTKAFAGKDEVIRTFAKQNVIAFAGSGNDKQLYEYLRGCYADLSIERPPVNAPQQYGWQKDWSFVHNSRIYKQDGSVKDVPVRHGLENLYEVTKSEGTLSEWRSIIELLIRKEQWDILTLATVGFGSALMKFTGKDGCVFHVGSTESGTGKSLSLELAASIWGHPAKYRVNKDTSPVAMVQRMGLLNSEPLIMDEITAKNRATGFEWLSDFLLNMTDARGKERMESGSNTERTNTTEWSSMSLLSSNTHAIDYFTGSREHSSEGELRRLIEYTLNKVLAWTPEDIATLKKLRQNYGVAGEAWVRWMVRNQDVIRTEMEVMTQAVAKPFEFTSDERYWEAGVVATLTAAKLLSSEFSNIVELPVGHVFESLKKRIMTMRKVVKGAKRSAEDILFAYIGENYPKMVAIAPGKNSQLLAALGGNTGEELTLTRSAVMGRVEKGNTKGYVDVFIEQKLIKNFCSQSDFGYEDFKLGLEAKYAVDILKKNMLSGTKAGAPMRVAAIHIRMPENEYGEVTGTDAVPVE